MEVSLTIYHFYPQIMGHEVSGEVVEVGSDVKNIRLGEKLALYTPRGAFCEYTMVNPISDLWVRIPESIPLRVRSLVEMFDGAFVSAVYPAQIKSDETVLIVGQGPMGLTAAATAKLTAKKEIIEAVKNETDGKGVDVAVVCISEDRSKELDCFDMTFEALRYRGRLVIVLYPLLFTQVQVILE